MNFRAKYFTCIEVKVPAGAVANKNYNFDPQSQVQTILGDQRVSIEAIENYPNGAIGFSPLTSINPVAAPGDITVAVLTLRYGSFEGTSQIPLAALTRFIPDAAAYTPAVWELPKFRDMVKIDWTKSYVTLVAAPATATAFSYLFGVYYDYLPL